MKKILLALTLAFAATSAQADFFGGNDGEWKMGPNGPYWDESDWPVWTPMYWMEEMMDSFDDEDGFGSNFPSFGGNNNSYGYQMPQMQMQQPYYGYPTAPAGYNTYPQQAPVAPVAPTAPAQ